MRIAHLSTVHSADDVRILHKECQTLAAAGHDVVFVVPGQGESWKGSVRIRYLRVPGGRWARLLRALPAVLGAALDEKADVYHFHDPELMLVGFVLRLRGLRVVYDVHEDAPRDILTKGYMTKPVRHLAAACVETLEWLGGRGFSGIVAATPRIASRFPRKRTIVVQNYPLDEEIQAPAATPYVERENVIAYVGGVASIRGAREMILAVGDLPDETRPRLLLAGVFSPPSLEDELRALAAWSRVEFLGWRPRAEVIGLLGRARVGLVLFHPVANHLHAQPNKLFEYMAAGLPVVASDFPLWREIIEGVGCGLLVDPEDPRAIADALGWLLGHSEESEAMGRRGRRAVERHFNWGVESQKLLAFYESLAASGGP